MKILVMALFFAAISGYADQQQKSTLEQVTGPSKLIVADDSGNPMAVISGNGEVAIQPGFTAQQVLGVLAKSVVDASRRNLEQYLELRGAFDQCMAGWKRSTDALGRLSTPSPAKKGAKQRAK